MAKRSRSSSVRIKAALGSWMQRRREQLQSLKEYVATVKEERDQRLAADHLLHGDDHPPAKEVRAKVDISVGSVIKSSVAVFLVAIGLYMLYLMSNVIALVLISFFFATLLNPFVDFMERYRIPRGAGVLISYLVILFAIALFMILLVPMLKTQGDKLVATIATYLSTVARDGVSTVSIPFASESMEMQLVATINQLRENFNVDLLILQFRTWLLDNQNIIGGGLEAAATNFLGFLNVVVNGLSNVLIVLLLTFFIVTDQRSIKAFFLAVLPKRHPHYMDHKLTEIQSKLGAWLRGQLILGCAVGTTTFLGFLILSLFGLHIEEYGIIAIIAGITEVIPVVGPIIAALIALLVAANYGPVYMLAVLILFILIQQLENNILVPVIMRHAVGLSSLVIIVCMLIGAQFFGILGLLLAVPVSTILSLFIHDLIHVEEGSGTVQ